MSGDLEFAHALADLADEITSARFRATDLRVETKPDLTPVSEADRAAEEAIRAHVAASGRGEGVLGEEFGDDGGDSKWIVDPIDGTKNYVRGMPVWATLLALEREGELAVGLVSAPALRRRWWAVRGGGAFCERRALPRLGGGERSRTRRSRRRRHDGCPPGGRSSCSVPGRTADSATSGSTASSRRGRSRSACDSVMNVWDYAPVQILVEEAGGRCTTYDGADPVRRQQLRHDERPAARRGRRAAERVTRRSLNLVRSPNLV